MTNKQVDLKSKNSKRLQFFFLVEFDPNYFGLINEVFLSLSLFEVKRMQYSAIQIKIIGTYRTDTMQFILLTYSNIQNVIMLSIRNAVPYFPLNHLKIFENQLEFKYSRVHLPNGHFARIPHGAV